MRGEFIRDICQLELSLNFTGFLVAVKQLHLQRPN